MVATGPGTGSAWGLAARHWHSSGGKEGAAPVPDEGEERSSGSAEQLAVSGRLFPTFIGSRFKVTGLLRCFNESRILMDTTAQKTPSDHVSEVCAWQAVAAGGELGLSRECCGSGCWAPPQGETEHRAIRLPRTRPLCL